MILEQSRRGEFCAHECISDDFSISRMEVVDSTNHNFLLGEIQNNPSFKGVYAQETLRSLYFNQRGNRESRFLFCKEILLTIPVVGYTRKDFYLLDAINKKIEMVITAGLVHFGNFENFDRNYLANRVVTYPKVLTTVQLSGSFRILAFGSTFGFIVFLCELAAHKWKCNILNANSILMIA